MKINRNHWLIAAAIIIAIILSYASCKIGQRSCPTAQTVEVIRWKTDTLEIVPPVRTVEVPTKEIIKVPVIPAEHVRLIDSLTERIANFQAINDAMNAQLIAIQAARPGEKVETVFPYKTTSGNSANADSTVFIKWRVKYLGELAPDTKESPNPYFEATVAHQEKATTIDNSKPNAIGIGAMAKSNGKTVDVAPFVNVRVGKVTGYFGYYLVDKAVVVGASREFQYGKKKGG
jgi:hypothetical protein